MNDKVGLWVGLDWKYECLVESDWIGYHRCLVLYFLLLLGYPATLARRSLFLMHACNEIHSLSSLLHALFLLTYG